ncbi:MULTISPECIES: hypothetical protein [Paraburkholderia]|uniref:SMP-30/Gluconolactonase/LRE-like region domain-containing protein n=1 Tax=Paraburkholderia madseniana TaxID=2599607 RepID=A0A6N6WEE8_9BURK|nr:MULTISPECIES: hypothetical protein [Paraburkholderia]KAE8759017.1 hypothetical protein FSO04_15650 [Paraburkholderia madseniana]MCX4150755.1 hypothetical protein [Paraburkholderia madseniana]MCX4171294.1 hypothetical protein [Paraburkholderia madseniana]MDN7153688.1 hypothetical protein [Paraburkholderia sp. WS6]MDQ6412570.1 hypothetical protein [Paraburkholderia madseniana]
MIATSLVSSRRGFLQPKHRSTYRNVLRSILLSATLGLSALSVGQSSRAQELFVGDVGDSSVKHFDASSGTYLGAFIAPKTAGLKGPMGMIFTGGQLVVVNQNLGTGKSGEVLQFDSATGTFVGKLVASSDRNAPFAPRGIVRGGRDNGFYVADIGDQAGKCANQGNVKEYDAAGAFLGNLDRSAFTNEFHPRGVVFGPDGLLYVSAVGCLDPKDPLYKPLIGYILRFDARTKAFVDMFASNTSVPDLHRPEGLVFDSAGNLWVTSFRAASSDSDKILKLDGRTGVLLDELILSAPGAARAFAQAIIFGPGGNLFIPITGGDATTAGQVRRCSPTTKLCDVIVPANSSGGALQQPFYLIFRNTNPATLNYED